jgi:hypothetical protein
MQCCVMVFTADADEAMEVEGLRKQFSDLIAASGARPIVKEGEPLFYFKLDEETETRGNVAICRNGPTCPYRPHCRFRH